MPDGRVIVKKGHTLKLLVPRKSTLRGFRILFAYGEKCLADPDIMKDRNLAILGIVAGAKQPYIGYFTEVFE